MRILHTADWHIKLGQRHVPKHWQIDRFLMLVDHLNNAYEEGNCDLHIIGGDIFDTFDPSADEVELYFELISRLKHPTWIYSGNHEMVSKTKSVLFNYAEETTRCNPLVEVITCPIRCDDFDIVDYVELHKKKWKPQQSRLCFTHVRGAIPPHVIPEIDLSRFDCYDMVIAGDLHSYKNTQATANGTPIIYPGSPLTTSFHRERSTKSQGYIIINTNTKNYSWHDLSYLPQLIRKTISATDEMVEDKYDRVIYEVEGDISELKGIKDSELLDKRVNKNVGKPATLNLSDNPGLCAELDRYYAQVQQLKKPAIDKFISRFKKVIPDAD